MTEAMTGFLDYFAIGVWVLAISALVFSFWVGFSRQDKFIGCGALIATSLLIWAGLRLVL